MSSHNFQKKNLNNNKNYMKDAIDFLTQIVEKDDTRASFSKKLTHDPENSHQNNKENHLQKQTTRKPSIYSSRNSTASLLKNIIDCNNNSEDDPTLDTNKFVLSDERSSSKNSSRFQTPQKNSSRNSSKKSKNINSESSKKIDTTAHSKRLYDEDQKIKLKKENLRKKYLEEEKKTMRNNPKINERSKIISNSDNKRPLFLRVNDIQKRKNEEIAKRKNLLEKQQKEKEPEPSFIPNLSLTKKKEDKLRSIPQFLNDVDDWNKKKKDKSEKFHIALLTEEMKENTFHPQIDKHSLKIILQKPLKPNEKETKIHKIKQDFDNNHTFKPQIDENSIKLMKKKKHNSRKSIMDPTLTHLNRLNETKFKSVVRKMSLDADVVKILSSTFLDSKKEYYEGKDRMKRGKSVCFIQTLNKSEKKIKEMEDVLDKELSFKKNSQNKVEYDRSLRFLVKIAAKKEH